MGLPLEVWLEILDRVAGAGQAQTLSVLCRVSKCFHDLATPRLYKDLHFIIEEGSSLGSRLTRCLLLPGHDQRWGKLVKGVRVTISGRCGCWNAAEGFVFLGLALVLERIEPDGLERLRWDLGVKPHKTVIDALSKQKKMRTLDFWMPCVVETSPIFEVFGKDHFKYLRKLAVRGIEDAKQLSEVAAALKHMDLANIKLAGDPGKRSVESLDVTWILPPQLKGGVSNLTSIDLLFFDLSDLESHIYSFFNPCTLRTLSLSDCRGYAALLAALSTHSGVRENLRGLYLSSSSADCDITSVINLIAACGNLKELSLDLFSFDKITIPRLLDATQGSRKSLEFLSLEFPEEFCEQDWLQSLKSMERLRQLAINCKMNTVDLMEVGIHFPKSLRVAVIGFPKGALEFSYNALLPLVRSFCNARPDLPFLDTIAISDGERSRQFSELWFGISYSEDSLVPFPIAWFDCSYATARADRRILTERSMEFEP